MSRLIIDTNILVRLIVKDDGNQFRLTIKALEFIERNSMEICVPTVVIVESCWVLKSVYKLPIGVISTVLTELLESENVVLEDSAILSALDVYAEKRVDIVDAYLAVKSKETPILTWDKKDFRKMKCEYFTPEMLLET